MIETLSQALARIMQSDKTDERFTIKPFKIRAYKVTNNQGEKFLRIDIFTINSEAAK